MSININLRVQKKNENGTYETMDHLSKPEWYTSNIFAFLAGVRNVSMITPLSKPRGLPLDLLEQSKNYKISFPSQCYTHDSFIDEFFDCWSPNVHSVSWLFIDELLSVDYSQMVENRSIDGVTVPKNHGVMMSLEDVIGKQFIKDIQNFHKEGAHRIVFCFD